MKTLEKAAGFPVFLLVLLLCLWETDGSLTVLAERGGRFWDILRAMVPPDIKYLPTAAGPLWATVQMSFLGTVLGALLGLGGALCSNAFLNPVKPLRILLKGAVHLLRCIPALILALVCTFAVGLGVFAGTLALTISTAAVLSRLGCEDLESMDFSPARALTASGSGRLKAFWRTLLPGLLPGYLTNVLYLWEANVRHAAILGYVGAGGIGLLLNERLAWRQYSEVGAILLLLYLLVLAAESSSEYLRRLLQGEVRGSRWAEKGAAGIFLLLFAVALLSFPVPTAAGQGMGAVNAMTGGLLHPDLSLLFSLEPDGVPNLLLQTFCIAFLGTLGGTVLALFFSFLSSFRLLPFPVALCFRLLLLAVRTIPVMVYGLMWIRVTGPGPFAGVLTLMLCSVGLLSKRFLIALEEIQMGPYKALRAMGNGRAASLCRGLVPQLLPRLRTAVLYRLDVNLREAAALGLVGAGGIGTPLILALMHYAWNEAGALLWGLVALVTLVEIVSEEARKRERKT